MPEADGHGRRQVIVGRPFGGRAAASAACGLAAPSASPCLPLDGLLPPRGGGLLERRLRHLRGRRTLILGRQFRLQDLSPVLADLGERGSGTHPVDLQPMAPRDVYKHRLNGCEDLIGELGNERWRHNEDGIRRLCEPTAAQQFHVSYLRQQGRGPAIAPLMHQECCLARGTVQTESR
ncbi:hypothetical protein ACF07L_37290 [Streptomyces anulatus]|uniref:hypothetical protein n=1 Tax=Streptomyces anulatus TaxID=1892 RepID=UPI0036F67310